VTLKSESDYIVGCEVVNGDETVLVVCENGFGKRTSVENFRHTNRGGVGVRSIIVSERNGNVVGAICVTDQDGVLMMSSSGQTVRISMRDLRVLSRNTQGVKLANLKDKDSLIAIQKVENAEEDVEVSPDADSPIAAVEAILDEESPEIEMDEVEEVEEDEGFKPED
jgi:DNA gyrase subunit A